MKKRIRTYKFYLECGKIHPSSYVVDNVDHILKYCETFSKNKELDIDKAIKVIIINRVEFADNINLTIQFKNNAPVNIILDIGIKALNHIDGNIVKNLIQTLTKINITKNNYKKQIKKYIDNEE